MVGVVRSHVGARLAKVAAVTLLVVACSSSAGSRGSAASGSGCARGQHVDKNVPYQPVPVGTPARLVSLDIYAPVQGRACRAAPVVVFVHGGGWRQGDKAEKEDLGPKPSLARARGWVLVSVNYRLAPAVRWPTFDDDVARAVVWVHRHAAEFGGDPGSLVLMGHSAGAAIVAGVATDERHLERAGGAPSMIRCTIPVDSVYDISVEARSNRATIVRAFGNDPAVWVDASPLRHVRAGSGIPRFLIITRGPSLWTDTANRLANELRAARVPVLLLDAGSTITHSQVNTAIGAPGEHVETPAIVSFVDSCHG